MPTFPRLEEKPSDWQLHPLAAAIVAAGMLAPGGALAATLTVTTLANASGSACTLRDAVHAVNAQFDQGACVAELGGGAYGDNDSIVFAPVLSGTMTVLAAGEHAQQSLVRQMHVAVEEQQMREFAPRMECRDDRIARAGDQAFVADGHQRERDALTLLYEQRTDVVDVHLAAVRRRADQEIRGLIHA
ncbi:MAG: hypothetical protein ACREYD_01210 [Casimicrobiaceae bacterium]